MIKRLLNINTWKSIAGILCLAMLFSCVNDPEEVRKVKHDPDVPVEWGEDVEIMYSERADMQVLVKCPRFERFQRHEIQTEMPDGIEALFYDSLGAVNSWLTAGWAIDHMQSQKMEAKYNVVVVNEYGDTLNTEHIIWDRKTRKIYTDEFVRIITHNNEVIYGENGMTANERFTRWRINGIKQSSINVPGEDDPSSDN